MGRKLNPRIGGLFAVGDGSGDGAGVGLELTGKIGTIGKFRARCGANLEGGYASECVGGGGICICGRLGGEAERGGVESGEGAGVGGACWSNIGCRPIRTLGNPIGACRFARLLNGDWGILSSSSCFSSRRSLYVSLGVTGQGDLSHSSTSNT